jgi:hypothetical protein
MNAKEIQSFHRSGPVPLGAEATSRPLFRHSSDSLDAFYWFSFRNPSTKEQSLKTKVLASQVRTAPRPAMSPKCH